jgi:hypothetical protein
VWRAFCSQLSELAQDVSHQAAFSDGKRSISRPTRRNVMTVGCRTLDRLGPLAFYDTGARSRSTDRRTSFIERRPAIGSSVQSHKDNTGIRMGSTPDADGSRHTGLDSDTRCQAGSLGSINMGFAPAQPGREPTISRARGMASCIGDPWIWNAFIITADMSASAGEAFTCLHTRPQCWLSRRGNELVRH